MRRVCVEKLSSVLVLVAIALWSAPANAQITDVLDPILQHLAGFTVWISHANFVNDSVSGDALRYGLGLKYGPIGIGPVSTVWDTSTDRQFVVHWDSCAKSYCRDSTATLHVKPRGEHAIQASVTFGYNYTTTVHFDNGRGFTANFPFGGIYLAAYARLIRLGAFDLMSGLQMSFYSLSQVPAQYDAAGNGPAPLLMTTSTTISPEVSLGIRFAHLLFLNASYQFLKFSGVRYESASSTDLGSIYGALPHTLPLNAFHIAIGVTLEGSIAPTES